MAQNPTFSVPEMKPDNIIRELILYIAQACADDPTFGDVKLNKILQFADFEAFKLFGKPITGAEYMKEKKGIVLKRMLPIREKMLKDDDIQLDYQPVFTFTRTKVVAKRSADLSKIDPRAKDLLDQVIKQLWNKTSDEVSKLSQQQVGYKVTEAGDAIPYEAALLSNEELTEADKKRTEELVLEHGWKL